MKKIVFSLLLTSLSCSAYAGCLENVLSRNAETCRSSNRVGSIFNCIRGIDVSINACKQQLSKDKAGLVLRKEKILSDEIVKIERATNDLMAKGITNKQNARYLALKELIKDFTSYSDNVKGAVAKSNSAYIELKAISMKASNEAERLNKINSLEKIAKRLNNESKNAQIYFDEFKTKFLAKEALLDLDIVKSALIPIQNLKAQNDFIASLTKEAIEELKGELIKNSDNEISFSDSFEALVRESENQESLLFACENNNSKNCQKYVQINKAYHAEVAQKILSSKAQVEKMNNLVLKNKILEAGKKDDLVEYGRLYDLAKVAGDLE